MKIKKFLPVIGILIFVYLLIKLDALKILKEISSMNLFFLLVSLFFLIINVLTETLKWFVIARHQKIKVLFFEAVRINLIGNFYGFVTPSKVGNVIRAEYLKKYSGNKIGKGVSNFILDKVLDICSLIVLAIMFSFISVKMISINYLYFSALLLIFILICLIVFMDKEKSKKIMKIFYKKLVPERLKEKAKKSFYSFYEDMPKKRYILLYFAVYLLNWVAAYLVVFFIGRSVQIDLSFLYFLAILPIATLVAQIPITISGLGTRELTIIGLFGLLGVDATKVFSMSIISLFIGSVIPAMMGFFLSLAVKRKKSD